MFFILEVATALAYYATWDKVRPRTHLLLIWLYFFAAYMSLVVIQGIISFMLTPGRWVETRSFWDGFLNPTYLPGPGAANRDLPAPGRRLHDVRGAAREGRRRARRAWCGCWRVFQVVGVLLAYGGYRWWEGVAAGLGAGALPRRRAADRGARRDAPLPALGAGRSTWCSCCSRWLLPRAQRWPLAAVALLAAFAFFGGYERLREGSRKPFVIRDYMFSNGCWSARSATSTSAESCQGDAGPRARATDTPESRGRAVFRAQCASCHTVDGYLSIRDAGGAGRSGDLIAGDSDYPAGGGRTSMRQASTSTRGTSPPTQLDYPFMPPFVGTDEELEALVAYLVPR